MRAVYRTLPASSIFNACDPGLLFNVAQWYGEDWWCPELDGLRGLLRDWFIELFDAETGHYTRLRESIARSGIENPIVITAGKAVWREAWMLPENVGPYICESCGGSRLMIATELGLDVPCVVNDQIGTIGEVLASADDVLAKFKDKRYTVDFGPPVRVHPQAFSHMPDNYTFRDQQVCRQKVKAEMIRRAENWKSENTNVFGM